MSPHTSARAGRRAPAPRAGLSPADVIVGFAVVAVAFLFILMALPRSRETARLATCRRNLAQVGQALLQYDASFGALPWVGPPIPVDRPIADAPPSPQKAMLDALGVADFLGIDLAKAKVASGRGRVPTSGVVPGFACPSDVRAFGAFPSPISYRASVGSDHEGTDGPFAPGRSMSLAEIARRDGLNETAAFAERLLGDGRDQPSPVNYGLVPAVTGARAGAGTWRGDAGSTWLPADYRHTLYTHAEPPSAATSLVALDGRSSSVGASSAHVSGVNVLMLDGSTRGVTRTVDAKVWRAMGSAGPEPTPPAPPTD